MRKLFLDIETIPCDDSLREIFINHKKSKMDKELSGDQIEELVNTTSFDGAFGRICCIGYIKEGEKLEKSVLKGDEKEILKKFWQIAYDVDLFIGHNILEFDFPFIYKRSIVHGIKPRRDITFRRYVNYPIFDTMFYWENWNMSKKVKLDLLAKIFGLPTSKDEMDGSMVWPYFKEGKIDEICKYCMKDVELTRKIYYKMVVEDVPQLLG